MPSTAAAPDMSNFISSMLSAGLMEMPPESNVTPFPTRHTGFVEARPRYSMVINRGSWADP